jgi:YVTN family beta-propeller protein
MKRLVVRTLAVFGLAVVLASPMPVVGGNNSSRHAKVLRQLPLGGDGRWDYLLVDPDTKRLFIARSTRFMVVNTESGELIGEIPDTPGAHGVALASDLGVGFTSNGQENRVSVFDLKTLRVKNKIETGKNPDAIVYHAATREVFVFNSRSHDVTVIDAASQRAIATISLRGKPEFAVADDHGNIYVNVADNNSMAVIDAAERKVKATWPLGSCEEPTGLALDLTNRTAFASCGNKRLAVISLADGRVRQTVPIGDDCDAVAFDPTSGLVFASNGEGTLTSIRKNEGGTYDVNQTLHTKPGSKTMALDTSTQRIYVPAAKFTGPPTAKPRPQVIPGSFEVLVISE